MPQPPQNENRPSPEALLEEVQKERRGKLKIFLGAAPGVGKTYEMLLAAHKKKADGIDVAVGIVETHGRKETEALIAGLEILPRKAVEYKGRELHEMDIDAILKRRPALVLVDELAHTNAEGSRHPKRYQDVEELRAAGIDVYSTLNIQHIESLNDVVARITRVRIRETIPDSVFDTADDVEVIDLTPDELIQRLREGKVYAGQQAQRALDHYFKPGNITALRELALRRTAERVDDQMRQYMRKHAIRDIWAASERILVCINESQGAASLVRAAKRVADRLDGVWFAIYFETARTHQLSESERDRVANTMRLAEQLGAETMTLPGTRRIADDVLAFARDNNITQIVVGKSARPWWFELMHGSVVHELVKRPSGINVHVLAEANEDKERGRGKAAAKDDDGHPQRPAPTGRHGYRVGSRQDLQERALGYFYSAAMVGAATLLGRAVLALVDLPNISIVFLAAVLWSAARYGLRPSLFTSVLSTFCYSFFFAEPLYTFNIADPSQVLALVFFCIAGALTSTLTSRERLHASIAGEQAKTTAELFVFSRKLAGIRKLDTLLAATAGQVANMLKVDAMLLLPDGPAAVLKLAASAPDGAALDAADLAAATWCWEHNQPTGRGTDTLPGTRRLFLPLRTGQGKVGVIGVSRAAPGFLLTPPERRLLDALVDLAAIATERIRLAKDVDQARMLAETEKLRSALLTSISHDLRTPLASIIGSISSLRSYGTLYTEETREEMLATALDEAERLNRYVANLLDMTQLDAGALVPNKQSCDLQDLVNTAVRRCGKQLSNHKIRLNIPPNLPLLILDDVLMEQVLVNLLDNAAKYTPAGSQIEIGASRHKFSLAVSVRDEGPGIPEEDLPRVFDKFFRVRQASDRGRSGTGLGLAICRGFVEAMGGRIYARNRNDRSGAEFIIEFSPEVIAEPVAEKNSSEAA
ncbi:MAG: sensor histidine kinase KdpD [Nevskia sp.]|nr:sensor histidine kinase KdpD [Nevskia sp.]